MKKLYSIKVKFLQLKVITIICCLILLGIVLLIGVRFSKLKDTIETTREMNIRLTAIQNLGNSFLLGLPANHEYFTTGHDSVLDDWNVKTDELKNNFKSITENLGSGEIHQLIGKLDSTVSVYSSTFNDLAISLKEMGNESNGVISNWLSLSQEISDSLKLESEQAYTDMQNVSKLQLNYLISYNSGILDEINNQISEIKETENAGINGISGKLDKLSQAGTYLSTLHKRIGNRNEPQTLKGDFFQSYHILNTGIDEALPLITNLVTKRQYLLSSLFAILLFTLLAFLFFSYNKLARSVIYPLHKIKVFLQELRNGKFPDKVVEIEQNADMNEVADALNRINNDLKAKTNFVNELVKNNYTATYELMSDEDELGKQLREVQKKIKEITEEQKKYNEENEIRRYVNEGLAKFSEILRIHGDNLEKLTDEFIKNLVKYLDTIQGGIFIIDESDSTLLKLTSSFAYNRKKYNSKEIHVGEGLVGTCALEKKFIYINEIPEDYITITSGLGDAPPDNLLLIPMLQEEELLGVIEIASLNKFKDYEIDFTQQVANNLASEITSTRNNQRTNQLLAQSQQQAQQMAEQEEEMRQNMEELMATQEESSRRETELTGIVKAVDNTLYVVEYDMEGNIIRANNKLIQFLHLDNQISGKPYSAIQGDQKKPFLTKKMIEKVTDGVQVENTAEIVTDNKTYKIRQFLSLVTSKDGLPVKILHFIVDIT